MHLVHPCLLVCLHLSENIAYIAQREDRFENVACASLEMFIMLLKACGFKMFWSSHWGVDWAVGGREQIYEAKCKIYQIWEACKHFIWRSQICHGNTFDVCKARMKIGDLTAAEESNHISVHMLTAFCILKHNLVSMETSWHTWHTWHRKIILEQE